MTSLKQQILAIFDSEINYCVEHITQPSLVTLNQIKKEVLGLLDGYDIHPKGERVCIQKKQLEEWRESGIFEGEPLISWALVKKLLEESK